MKRLAVLLPLWLAVVIGDPGYLHSCPRHGGGDHAHASGAMAAHARSHEQTRAPDSHSACSCVGSCCASTPTALPASHAGVALLVAARASVISGDGVDAIALATQLRLPFANAPPVAPAISA